LVLLICLSTHGELEFREPLKIIDHASTGLVCADKLQIFNVYLVEAQSFEVLFKKKYSENGCTCSSNHICGKVFRSGDIN